MTNSQKEQIKAMRLQGLGYLKIGKELGISNHTVRSFCCRNGLTERAENIAVSKQCGKTMKQTPKCKPKTFCCNACRIAWWNSHPDCVKKEAFYHFTCAGCGSPFTAYGNSRRKYCSHSCYLADRYGKERSNHD